MPVRMSKWKTAFLHGLLLIFISYALSAGYDYDYEDQKVDSWGRCPWIRNRLKNGRVRVRSRGRIAKFTCKSGYELVGRKFATCVRGQWNNPIPMCIAKGCSKISAIANGVITEKYKGAQLTFECNPGYSLQGDASIFCDGSQWDKSAPRCDAATAQPQKSCDFEDPDLCGWSHDPTHDFDWRRHQFKTPSGHVGTGPSYDHTFGKGKAGYYMYEETSAPRNANDASRLFSPVYSKNNSPGCFVFWYHMYGATVGSLRIYIKPESHVLVEQTPTWEKSSDQGNQWLRGYVTVPPLNENFQIVIEGIRGTSYLGDIAIDDVNLLKNNCSSVDSSNTTESEEASGDSCRGRCHESDNSTTCGCTVSCESENTCCADYAKLCTESGSETPNGEDESVTGKQETEGTPEDKVGTDYTAVTPILSTEFITPENQPTVTENVIEKSTKQGVSTVRSNSSWPSTTTVGLNTSTTSTTTIPSTIVPAEHVSVSVATQNTRNVSSVTTTTQTIPTTSAIVAVSKAIATIAVTTITTGGPLTTTSSVTSEETTSRKSTTGVLNVTLPVTGEILIVPSTLPSKPPPTNNTREPTTIPSSTTSTTTAKITAAAMPTDAVTTGPPVTNNSFAIQTTSKVPQGEEATSKSTLPTTAVPTTSRIITTLTTGKILKTSSTTRSIPSTSTTKTSVKLTTQVPPKRTWPTRPTRRRPTLPPAIPTTLSTYFINRKTTKTTTVVSVFYKNSVYFTAKSQTTTVDPLKDGTHALKSETVVPKSSSSSVIGASVGVIIIVCLIGGVTFVFLRRRRQKLDKLHDDSIRFLPDNELIEYSEASATDSLFQS